MKESDIRKLDKVKGFFEQESKWMSQFAGKNGLVKSEYTLNVSCPCCGKKLGSEVMVKYFFRLEECKRCFTIYVNPRFKRENIDYYYKDREKRVNYIDVLENGNDKNARIRNIFIPRKEFIERELSNIGKNMSDCSLLDIGCATGQFLSVFNSEKYPNLLGVEASHELAKIAQSRLPNAKIYSNCFERCNFESDSFDIITLWEVLEHLVDPFEVIQKVEKLLKPGGVVFLSMPNIEGFDIQILWDRGNAFSPPSHLNYFRKSSVCRLFERVGLKVVDVVTPGQLDVDIVRNRLEVHADVQDRLGLYWAEIIRNDSEEGRVTRKNLQEFIRESGLSSHMLVTCEKGSS